MDIRDVLNMIRKKHGFKSDEEVALAVGRTRVRVAQWKAHKGVPDEDAIEPLARLSGISAEVLSAHRQVWINKGAARARWERIVNKLTRSAAALCVALAVLLMPTSPAQASRQVGTSEAPSLYIMHTFRRLRRWIRSNLLLRVATT